MKHYTQIDDISDLHGLVRSGLELKKNPLKFEHLGKGKTLGMLFLNPSLRTRLSTQIAAENLGLRPTVIDAASGWKLETQTDVVMNEDKAEHLIEAAGVIGSYFDILAFRSFPSLTDRQSDYDETLMRLFQKHSKKPLISLESATGHPLQSLADLITLAEHKKVDKPKVVLTWAPHPRLLPQAVSNTFAQFAIHAGYDLTIAHPEGIDLSPHFTDGATITHNQDEALENADFVYVKNWSSYSAYGQKSLATYEDWMITPEKLIPTNKAKVMHCLPVRRNVVIDQRVLDGPSALVIPQAQNRIYAAQAVLKSIIEAQ